MARVKHGLPGIYNSSAITLSDGEGSALAVNENGELIVNLETADIEIGAVEIKNSTSDTRATVGANGLYVDVRAIADVDIDDISKGTQTNDVKVTLDSEQVDIADISKGTQTNDVKITLDNETVVLGAGTASVGEVNTKPGYRSDSFQATIASADASSATQVKAKTADKNIYVTDVIISTDTALNIQLQDDAGTPVVLMEQIYMPANTVFSKSFITPLKVATNQDLDVIASAAGNISVTVTGFVV